MKKHVIYLISALLIASGSLFGQKQFYFGVGGMGLNTWVTNQNNYGLPFEMDYAITIGGGANANIGFDFSKHVGLKIEVGFERLGQTYKDDLFNDTTYTRNVSLNYLEVPLLFKYRTSGKIVRFCVLAGPQFNFLMSAKQKYYKYGKIDTDYIFDKDDKPVKIGEETITDRYTSLDILGRLDLGVDITLVKNLFLNAGLTMAYGFLDVNATNMRIADHTGNYNASHNILVGINFGINYAIPLGAKK